MSTRITDIYRSKVQPKANYLVETWAAAVTSPGVADRYAEGIARFTGLNPADIKVRDDYRNGIQAKLDIAKQKYVSKLSSEQTARKWAAKYIVGVTKATGDQARNILRQFGL